MATFAFSGGTDSVIGWGQRNRIRFTGTWAAGEYWTLRFTSTGGDFTLGAGNLLGAEYNSLLTYGDRVFAANGDFWGFSAVGDPTGWEEQDIGAGTLNFQTSFGFVDKAVGLGVIQGRMAVFGRRNIQMWEVDADPLNFSRIQTMQNIGTVAEGSIQSIGELDLMFLDDTGVRSLRTRETTLNAYVQDLGSPIDQIVQEVLAGLTDAEKALARSVVEPSSKRYWLFLDGVIYVLSNFPSSEIVAWSTYKPTRAYFPELSDSNYSAGGQVTLTDLIVGATYEWTKGAHETSIQTAGGELLTTSGDYVATATTATVIGTPLATYTGSLKGQKPFVIDRAVVYNGRVYIRTSDGYLLIYGGASNQTYDNSVPIIELPWHDLGSPSTIKQGKGFDAAMKGRWHVYASMNPRAAAPKEVTTRGSATTPDVLQDSTYDVGHFPYSANGTHFTLKFIGQASSVEQKLSKTSFIYDLANKK